MLGEYNKGLETQQKLKTTAFKRNWFPNEFENEQKGQSFQGLRRRQSP